ncbi:MAG: cytosolic protein [Anaerolineae bacterium]|nr:cytosolic protein [Anaerolineae bacterium]
MNPLNLEEVSLYVNEAVVTFHQHRIESLERLRLDKLLEKNPYLFKAKYITRAGELMENLLGAFLSSSEEKFFGDFLEGLAIYVAGKTCGGHKSTAPGVDLEFINQKTHYVISIKSGPHWGNSSQHKKLAQDLRAAETRLKQARSGARIQTVLGICYGRTRTAFTSEGYLKVVGQNFWYLISENEHLYTEIIEPIGYRAREHNEAFEQERSRVVNRFTKDFIDQFCNSRGDIDWIKLVAHNSGNFDLDEFPL